MVDKISLFLLYSKWFCSLALRTHLVNYKNLTLLMDTNLLISCTKGPSDSTLQTDMVVFAVPLGKALCHIRLFELNDTQGQDVASLTRAQQFDTKYGTFRFPERLCALLTKLKKLTITKAISV